MILILINGCTTLKKTTQTNTVRENEHKVWIRPKQVNEIRIPNSELVRSNVKYQEQEEGKEVLFTQESAGVIQTLIKHPNGDLSLKNEVKEQIVKEITDNNVIRESERFITKIRSPTLIIIGILLITLILIFIKLKLKYGKN